MREKKNKPLTTKGRRDVQSEKRECMYVCMYVCVILLIAST